MARLLRVGILLLAASVARASESQRSRTCDGIDLDGNARDFLRDKTLTVHTCDWAPLSYYCDGGPYEASDDCDDDSPIGWNGLDFEILNRFAQKLGFNYTVVQFKKEGDEDWNEAMTRVMEDGSDAILTYWAKTPYRMNLWSLMGGHIDQGCATRRPQRDTTIARRGPRSEAQTARSHVPTRRAVA